jgi:hypothetical protein
MPAVTVTIDRSSLTLADLVISSNPATGLWVPETGITRPTKRWRRRSVDSPWFHGSTLTAATLEPAVLGLTVYLQETSTAALEVAQAELETALWQFTYTVTESEAGGAARVWDAEPADIDWGVADSGMANAYLAKAEVVIPVHPVPGV